MELVLALAVAGIVAGAVLAIGVTVFYIVKIMTMGKSRWAAVSGASSPRRSSARHPSGEDRER